MDPRPGKGKQRVGPKDKTAAKLPEEKQTDILNKIIECKIQYNIIRIGAYKSNIMTEYLKTEDLSLKLTQDMQLG